MDTYWKDIATIFGPIAGVLIGWFLNEFGQLVRLRREDRRILGKAIAILLNVYDSAVRLRTIEKHLHNSPGGLRMFKDILNQLVDIQVQYEETVSALAASDPVGAYDLRSKVLILNEVYRKRKDHFENLSENDKRTDVIEAFKDLDQLHQAVVSDRLRSAIFSLARKHGWLTLIRAKRALNAIDSLESSMPELGKKIADSYMSHKSKGL